MSPASFNSVHAIEFSNNQLTLLDQRLLPSQESYLHYTCANDIAQAITDMVVRGAPAIGITAAYGIVLAAIAQRDQGELKLDDAFKVLAQSRPTAVNLFWALEKMQTVLNDSQNLSIDAQISALTDMANRIHEEDIINNQIMGKLGASLIESDSAVYTHCNAGALATGGFGTALGVIRQGVTEKKITQVYYLKSKDLFKK